MVSDHKQQTIKATLRATHAMWKLQRCRVFEFKITTRYLSTRSRTHLHRLFLEAKWFYNWVRSQPNVFQVDTTIQYIPIKVGLGFEKRPLVCLSPR